MHSDCQLLTLLYAISMPLLHAKKLLDHILSYMVSIFLNFKNLLQSCKQTKRLAQKLGYLPLEPVRTEDARISRLKGKC